MTSTAAGKGEDADVTSGATVKDVESIVPKAPVDWTKKNPIKALFFAQVTPLIAEGTVRRLEPTDLCHLDRLDSERVRYAPRESQRQRRTTHWMRAVYREHLDGMLNVLTRWTFCVCVSPFAAERPFRRRLG